MNDKATNIEAELRAVELELIPHLVEKVVCVQAVDRRGILNNCDFSRALRFPVIDLRPDRVEIEARCADARR